MMEHKGWTIAVLFLIVVTFLAIGSDPDRSSQTASAAATFGKFSSTVSKKEVSDQSLVIVGDVMLGRDVSRLMGIEGKNYPFVSLGSLLDAKYVLGNFEAAIPEEYKPTPAFDFNLAVSTADLSGLVESGVTHLSLANNHSLDSGEAGYQNTVKQLSLRGFTVAGRPDSMSTSSISYITLGTTTVAIININATYSYPDETEWLPVVSEAVRKSDMQLVYIHWGDEYQPVHNEEQEAFAHNLIDTGVDMLVGSHPHVIQDVGEYKGALIFYSLGNFIFDQYFDDEVRTELTLRLSHTDTGWQISLNPVESISSPAQPRPMTAEERKVLLADLAARSQPDLAESIKNGVLSLQF